MSNMAKKIENMDKMWEDHLIGTFVHTPTVLIGLVVGWMGMFMLIMCPDRSIKLCKNESCRPVCPPHDPHNRIMVPKKKIYIKEGRYKGIYGKIIGSIFGKVFMKPDRAILTEYLKLAGPYERQFCVVSCEDVIII